MKLQKNHILSITNKYSYLSLVIHGKEGREISDIEGTFQWGGSGLVLLFAGFALKHAVKKAADHPDQYKVQLQMLEHREQSKNRDGRVLGGACCEGELEQIQGEAEMHHALLKIMNCSSGYRCREGGEGLSIQELAVCRMHIKSIEESGMVSRIQL